MQVAFDSMAEAYDEEFTQTPIGICQREQVYTYLKAHLSAAPMRILELNCGTGEDAVWLAQQGHTVVATDISQEMVRITQRKVEAEGLGPQVKVIQSPIQEVAHILSGSFDLIFSNFGGWNCLKGQEIKNVAPQLHNLLRPTGRIMAVIMPDRCWWETIYYLGRGKLRSAFRRYRTSSSFTSDSGTVEIAYFSPKKFAGFFTPQLNLYHQQPIGFWVPPSYMNPFMKERTGRLAEFQKKDLALGSSWKARFADHCLVDLTVSTS